MKTLFLLCFIAGSSLVLADDAPTLTNILSNGDFSSGLSHWDGDCHTAGNVADDSGATSGLVVQLRNGDWTKMGQDFEGKSGDYILTITYIPSTGLTMSTRPDDYTNTPLKMELNGLGPVSTMVGKWCIMVVDSGISRYEYWQVTPSLSGSGLQTIKAHVTLHSDDEHEKGFYLGFPPGNGTINLQSISLTPVGGSTASN
jgi:hypothetical protein